MNLILQIAFTGFPYADRRREGSVVRKRQLREMDSSLCWVGHGRADQAEPAFALSPARRRKAQTERRLRWLEARWNDDAYFHAVMQSGRYLKLCMLMEWASEADARAQSRLNADEDIATA